MPPPLVRPELLRLPTIPQDVRTLLSSLPDGVLLLDLSGAILYANAACEALFGRRPHRILGEVLGRLVAPDQPVVLQLRRGPDDHPWIEVTHEEIQWGGQRAILCSLRDVTTREEANRELRETKDRLATLLEASFEAILLIDGETLVDANEHASTLFEYDRGELLALAPEALVAPPYRETVRQRIAANAAEPIQLRGQRR
ncbi:MAG: PAS domain S-box protein, partial [Candidatus Thermoplasmatota archaeon]|nr:PAS domain S-box protein [Candidatus Thermoplasmatota archaeon]